ncbi:MAG TPA: hypothetical protein VHL11_21750, partial [Phototrophicaceae bacterium]|nr:hypothetical protein [Phototrophicaceae bacterium]
MNRRNASKHVFLLLMVLLVTLSLSGVASAQTIDLPGGQATGGQSKAGLTPVAASKIMNQSVRLPNGQIQVIVSLSSDPAVISFIQNGGRANRATASAAADSRKASIKQEQAAFIT